MRQSPEKEGGESSLRPSSSTANALAVRKGVRKGQRTSPNPVSAASSSRASPSSSQPATTRRPVEMQSTIEDQDDFFRRDIANAWTGNLQKKAAAAAAAAAASAVASNASSSASTPTQSQQRAGRAAESSSKAPSSARATGTTANTANVPASGAGLPSFKRKDKGKEKEPEQSQVDNAAAAASSSASIATLAKEKTQSSLPDRPSAETIAAASTRLPEAAGLPSRPSEETRIAGLRAEIIGTRSHASPSADPARSASPAPRHDPPETTINGHQAGQEDEDDRDSSPPFQAGSPPATFDWLLSPPPESAPSASAATSQQQLPNGYTAATAKLEVDVRIASSQTPEPQQLTDAEMELEEVEAPPARTAINGFHEHEEMEVDELADDDVEGEVEEVVRATPDLREGSSPPSTVGKSGTVDKEAEVEKAAQSLLNDISQSLLDDIEQDNEGSARLLVGPRSASRGEDSEAEEVQGSLNEQDLVEKPLADGRMDSTATSSKIKSNNALPAGSAPNGSASKDCIIT